MQTVCAYLASIGVHDGDDSAPVLDELLSTCTDMLTVVGQAGSRWPLLVHRGQRRAVNLIPSRLERIDELAVAVGRVPPTTNKEKSGLVHGRRSAELEVIRLQG